ncbi:MAG: FAD-dependent oxidoreductase [Alphaproteobacteria bacterium]|nr:FAD-dependent oxidoreductase [Alphaproteobacteria bacterium]
MNIVVIGGGAGGASFAARMRRLDNSAKIDILEETNETSIASCGLPYFVGDVISNRENIQVATPQLFKQAFDIDIHSMTKAEKIDAKAKTVTTTDGQVFPYDKLILSTGGAPFVPPIKGLEKKPSFTLKTLKNADTIKAFLKETTPKSLLVVGGGFIGVEVAENLVHQGIQTTLVDIAPQVLPPLDADMVCQIHEHMTEKGVKLILGDGIKEITEKGALLSSGKELSADGIILALGIRPQAQIAKDAGIDLTPKGAIKTNEFMQTNFKDIYACGDSVAVKDFVNQEENMVALAGPANREGRLIADHILGKAPYSYTGTQGTGIVKVFDMTAAFTGNNEKQLQAKNIPYEKMIVWKASHAGYYPDAKPLVLKVLYGKDGTIFGAQAVGYDGVDKRIDVIATVMRLHGKTTDLRDAELCYAPPYSSAKDPVNIIGMAIENIRQGLMKPYFGTSFEGMFVVDVRSNEAFEKGHLPEAVNIPLENIKESLDKFPKDKPILIHCQTGYRSYVAVRILMENGFENVYSYAGGYKQYSTEIKGALK